MKIKFSLKSKYKIQTTSSFKKSLRKIVKQGKPLIKLNKIINQISKGEQLEERYKDHNLTNSKKFKDCRECHIEPDWLLIYRINNDKLILILIETGTHGDLF